MKNYSEPIITPDEDCYLRMMQEIKYRTEIIHLLINKDIDMIHPGVNNEVLALQIRMIIESISLASLAAHKNVFEEFSDKFRSFWRADKIFADIKKINPDFYPKPVTENYFTPPRVKNGIIVDRELIYRKDDFMTLDEMIDLHSKSCEFLHAQNPYSPIKDFRGLLKKYHHMPHYVGHRKSGTTTRWGLLMAYRTPDPDAEPEKWTNGIPTHWVEQTASQGKLSAAAQRMFEADNPIHKHLQTCDASF